VEAAARGTVGVVGLWHTVEIRLDGPSDGNPFVDVALAAEFSLTAPPTGSTAPPTGSTIAGSTVTIGGFYDGGGTYVLRFLPQRSGEWRYVTRSNATALDGISGRVAVGEAAPGDHGVVRVADTFHFAWDDGTRFLPLGTTAYAWTHQPQALQERTLRTLAASPFRKMRMAVFPKSYLFNANEPDVYPFEGSVASGWDFTRFTPEFFRRLEARISDLAALGIQTDLILFHAYDRWGFSDMGRDADDRYVQYVVRRLSAIPSVWWSLANEYDLLPAKSTADWERMAGIITANDPVGHLLSIHNCFGFYDHSRPWITHCSIQRIDVYRTAENTDAWRNEWQKPVVIDECAYEGDIDQGWGNITGEELVRRFWEGAVRGGYVGHGETYLNDREELWWSKGGELVGASPDRIRFLAEITAQSPTGVLDPLPGEWDLPWGGAGDDYRIGYFGFNRPRYRDIVAPPGRQYLVDIIDTWEMTVQRLEGEFAGSFRISLPARQYLAVRLTAVDQPQREQQPRQERQRNALSSTHKEVGKTVISPSGTDIKPGISSATAVPHVLAADAAQTQAWRTLRARLQSVRPAERDILLAIQARDTRRRIVRMISGAGLGHIGGDFSVTDILTTLFALVLNVDPANPQWDDRDHFILSKGHCSAALYTTLAATGFFSPDELGTFMAPLSPLNGHPNRNKVPGVETNTGPLGHGLPVGVGAALAAKITGRPSRVFVVVGDGEMQEGSNWEALMTGSQYQLANLTIVIDRNRLQQGARTEDTNALDPLDDKLASFGWEVREIDGHDFAQLIGAFEPSTTGRPVAVIANTTKGKGVSFIEDRVEWHHKVPSAEQVELALEELA
jgi:transketolase N-terminal domain/subunit